MNWARNYQRHMKSALRRLIRINDDSCHMDEDTDTTPDLTTRRSYRKENGDEIPISKVRTARVNTTPRTPIKTKKPGRTRRPFETKYGIKIPLNVKDAYEFDKSNGNSLWTDAIDAEINSLLKLKCFKFEAPNYKPGKDYQYTSLRMIFEAKQDARHKARLVAGGHLVKLNGMSSKSTVVKGISVRLLDIIAHRSKLETICGDVGNAFVTAPCLEKVFSRAGPEFGDKEDSILIIVKALYGLKSSSRAFRTYFADFIRTAGFIPARYDRDVWMRKRETNDGYDYICTHVDDFKIVAKCAKRWVDHIEENFVLKSVGPPSYYLGNDYNFDPINKTWVTGCATYIKECIRRVEAHPLVGGTLYPHKTPLPPEVHPELDTSPFLDDKGVKAYQMLIGMIQ